MIIAAFTLSLQAQAQGIQGPILGFTPDRAGTLIRPILGIPGASALEAPLPFDTNIRGAVISPKQDYAIAVRAEDAQVVVIDLTVGAPLLNPVSGAHPEVDLIAISPSGLAAGLYDNKSGTVQTLRGLPHSPEIIHEFDASSIPGRATSMAVSDDGAVALVRFVEDDVPALWVLDSSGVSWQISADSPSAAAFFPNSQNAIVTEDATASAFLIMDAGRTGTRVPLISAVDGIDGFSGVSASEDSLRVFLTSARSGVVAIVDMETRTVTSASCHCRPTGLYRLKGTSIFRLTDPGRAPVMVLDAGYEPRIVIIPPNASQPLEAQ